jgi:hypothetical protein
MSTHTSKIILENRNFRRIEKTTTLSKAAILYFSCRYSSEAELPEDKGENKS